MVGQSESHRTQDKNLLRTRRGRTGLLLRRPGYRTIIRSNRTDDYRPTAHRSVRRVRGGLACAASALGLDLRSRQARARAVGARRRHAGNAMTVELWIIAGIWALAAILAEAAILLCVLAFLWFTREKP